jgi:hypothetical protein
MKITDLERKQLKPKSVRTGGKYQFHDRTGAVLPSKRKLNDRRVDHAKHR